MDALVSTCTGVYINGELLIGIYMIFFIYSQFSTKRRKYSRGLAATHRTGFGKPRQVMVLIGISITDIICGEEVHNTHTLYCP